MCCSMLRSVVGVALLSLFVGPLGADDKKDKKDDKKLAIVLPKEGKTVVLSFDPGANGFIRKGEAPYLKIQADGQVTVTNVFDGTKKEAKLTAKELDELLSFVITENDLFNVTTAKIDDAIKTASANGPFIALGGASTSVIKIEANDKKHEVSYRGAVAYLKAYPKAKVLPEYVAVEKRLSDYAASVLKGKDKDK